MLKEQIEFYRENGYLLLDRFFGSEEIEKAVSSINDIINSNKIEDICEMEPIDKKTIRRIWSPTKRSSILKDMAESKRLLDLISELIGKNIVLHYSKLNMKGPKVGSIVEWHQDFSYYPHTNTDLLSCLIYLDDACRENGCLQVISKSHQLGLLDHTIDGFFRGKVTEDKVNKLKENLVYLEAPAGSVIFLHCLTLHYSEINKSEKPRRTFLPAYRAADAFPIYYGPHAAHNEPDARIVRGEKSAIARVEQGTWLLPFSEKKFNSLYEVQEGSHLKDNSENKSTGYYSNV